MRWIAVLLLLTALASVQLPWVVCGADSIHLDIGIQLDLGHDGENDDEHSNGHGEGHEPLGHQPLVWSATARTVAAPVLAATFLHIAARAPTQPAVSESADVRYARFVAPPLVAGSLTSVLLL